MTTPEFFRRAPTYNADNFQYLRQPSPFNMTQAASNPQNANPSNFGSSQDWASILSSIAQGTGNAFSAREQPSVSSQATNRREAKEAKRRTLANLMSKTLKREQGLASVGREYGGEMRDLKAQAMQQMARGFVQALQGSTA